MDTPPQNEPLDVPLYVLVSRSLKDRIEEVAADRGVSQGALAREILAFGLFPQRVIAGIDAPTVEELTERYGAGWQQALAMVVPDGTEVEVGWRDSAKPTDVRASLNTVRELITDGHAIAGKGTEPTFVLADEPKFAPLPVMHPDTAEAYQAEVRRLRAAALGGE